MKVLFPHALGTKQSLMPSAYRSFGNVEFVTHDMTPSTVVQVRREVK